MNTAVPMVWRMGPKYGLQESSPPPGGLVGSDWGSGRASSTCRCAGSGTGRRRAACSRCPASTLSWSVMIAPAAIADGVSVRPASMLAAAQAIAVRSLACAVSFGCLSFQSFPFLVCTSCRGREATPPVDAAWLASNGSNPATFNADGLYLPGFRPNSLIGFGVRLMGMVVFVSFNVHAKSVYSNIFSVFTKVFE